MNKLLITTSAIAISLGLISCNTTRDPAGSLGYVTTNTVGTGFGFVAGTGAALGEGVGTVVGTGVHVLTGPVRYHQGHHYRLHHGKYVAVD